MALAFEPTVLSQLVDEIAAEILVRREWVDACDYPEGLNVHVEPNQDRRASYGDFFMASLWSEHGDDLVEESKGSLTDVAAWVVDARERLGAR